jgi:hypothetical protein
MRRQRQIGRDHPNDWRHHEPGDRAIIRDRPKDFDLSRDEAKFLMRFSKRSFRGILSSVETTPGERNLSRMGAHVLTPNGQNQAGLCPVGDCDQDRRGRRRLGAKRGEVSSQ